MFKFNLAFLSKMAEFKVMIYFYYTFILLILSFTIIISESKHIKLEILQFPSFELVTGIVSSHRNFTELELDYKFNDNTLITVTCVSSSPVLMVYDYGVCETRHKLCTYLSFECNYKFLTYHDIHISA